jgi:NDP-sugar pyrophosphorylase family protein
MSTKIDYYFKHTDRFPFEDFFADITETYEILAKAKTYLKAVLANPNVCEDHSEHRGDAPSLHGSYYIGGGTVIYNGVTIIGPAYIGRDCEIMPGALIRPYTIIADGCGVGHGSEVKRSVLFSGAKVASLAFAGDCVLGASARIGSGVITANRRFDQKNAVLKTGDGKTDLGDSFFGCILGDSARLGANSVPSPGTHIGPYSWVLPLTSVRGFIPADTRVFSGAETVFAENPRTELKP